MFSPDAEHTSKALSIDRQVDEGLDCQADIDDVLEACLNQYLSRCPFVDVSELRSLLPVADEASRKFVLIELVKVDMAMTAESGEPRRIEVYSNAFPDLLPKDSIPLDLVMEEIQLRREMGETPAHQEYRERFPHVDTVINQLFFSSEATTANRKLKPPPELQCGTQVDDFLLVQELGKGAFATVYLAQQISMQRMVALKVSAGSEGESLSLAQFDHTNIVRIYDQRNISDQQTSLLYMQFHPGGTLSEVVKSVRALGDGLSGRVLLDCVDRNLLRTAQNAPDGSTTRRWLESSDWPTVVAWIGTQLAYALDHAHSRDVLHRDVKPANVLLSAEGIPKLADFNVSFAGSAGRAGASVAFGGSIGYMSPEHLRVMSSSAAMGSEKVEEPADLFSLGVLLWEVWQGARPFKLAENAQSWSDAVEQQLKSREAMLVEPRRIGGASERVLEDSLRSALACRPSERPANASEMAGKLRLAMHPEAARLFDFGPSSFRSRILKISPWLVATFIILLPNIAGGLLKFQYNNRQVMTDEMRLGLARISWFVNLTFFPFGAAIIIYYARSLIRAVLTVRRREIVSHKDIDDTLALGHRTALIGGSLWLVGGLVFPIALRCMYPDFTFSQAIHLVVSSLICGGVAMIYPFFGMALVATRIYYPCYLKGKMQDEHFDARRNRILKQSEAYLLIAALIPLLGATLMISSQSTSRTFILAAVNAGAVGLLASFFVHRSLGRAWSQLAEVLSPQKMTLSSQK